MGLMDKAKGFVDQHREQVEHGMQKMTDTVNKYAGGRNPNEGASGTTGAGEDATTAGGAAGGAAANDAGQSVEDVTEEVPDTVVAAPASSLDDGGIKQPD